MQAEQIVFFTNFKMIFFGLRTLEVKSLLRGSLKKDIIKSKYLGGLRMSMHYTQACAELTGMKA